MKRIFIALALITTPLISQITDNEIFTALQSLDPNRFEQVRKQITDYNMRNKEGDTLAICLVKAYFKNYSIHSGESALHNAARNKDFVLAERLISAGASPFQRDARGMSPFDIAAQNKSSELLALFAKSSDPRSDNFISILSALLESGADIESRGGDKKSLLYHATLTGNLRAVSLILSRKPKVDYRPSVYDETPLIAASRCGYRDIALLLIENGADVRSVVETREETSQPISWAKPESYNAKIVIFTPSPKTDRRCYYRVLLNNEEVGRTDIGLESEQKIFTSFLNPNTYLLGLEKFVLDERKNSYVKLNNIEQVRPQSYYFDTRSDRITVVTVRHDASSESSYFSEFER